MNQISEMDDELRPEYDFARMTPVARGQGRKRAKTHIVNLPMYQKTRDSLIRLLFLYL